MANKGGEQLPAAEDFVPEGIDDGRVGGDGAHDQLSPFGLGDAAAEAFPVVGQALQGGPELGGRQAWHGGVFLEDADELLEAAQEQGQVVLVDGAEAKRDGEAQEVAEDVPVARAGLACKGEARLKL